MPQKSIFGCLFIKWSRIFFSIANFVALELSKKLMDSYFNHFNNWRRCSQVKCGKTTVVNCIGFLMKNTTTTRGRFTGWFGCNAQWLKKHSGTGFLQFPPNAFQIMESHLQIFSPVGFFTVYKTILWTVGGFFLSLFHSGSDVTSISEVNTSVF